MEARYTDKDIPDSVVQQYKQAAQQAPQDRRKLFQWGYASYLMYAGVPSHTHDFALFRALGNTLPPYSYEFQRMHYLLDAAMELQDQYSLVLGQRLAAHEPKDYSVRVYVCRNFPLGTPEGKSKALQYAHELMQIAPERAYNYAAVANVYHSAWILSSAKDNEAARQAVQYYHEYIRHETRPFMAANKKTAQDIIDKINRYIAQADAKGKSR